MNDVTVLMDEYRECVRHLWNASFSRGGDAGWDDVAAFREAAAVLFRALVLRRLDHESSAASPLSEQAHEPLLFLRVHFQSDGEILINREQSSGYWDHPVSRVRKGDLELAFLGYFDWDLLGHRDLAYYRVRIVGSPVHAGVVGKDALVPVGPHVRVVCGAAQQGDEADEASAGAPSRP